MASAPARPARRPSPHARNSALLFIGYQPAPLAGARSMDRALPVKNAVSTVRTTKAFGIPVVHSTINVAADREQPTLPDLAGIGPLNLNDGCTHLVIRSYEPGEDWYWCYLDRLVFELQGAPPAPSHP
jgi:hypothetical protein